MNLPQDTQKKVMAAYNLLSGQSISISAFEQVRELIKGLHPGIDSKLEFASKAIAKVEKLQNGDVISLTAEHLPEDTEENRKRKKALLFFINAIKNLKSEIKRVEGEMQRSQGKGQTGNIKGLGRIIAGAKGPLGLVTVAAVVIVAFVYFTNHSNVAKKLGSSVTPSVTTMPAKQTIQVIVFNGKQIPLSQTFIGHGSDCDSPHYHALNEISVTALDGTVLQDPGGCGFGKVKDMQIISIPVSQK